MSVPLNELRRGEIVTVTYPEGGSVTGKVEQAGLSFGDTGAPFAYIAPLGYHLAQLIVAPATVDREPYPHLQAVPA
jgi:hypothetical protein